MQFSFKVDGLDRLDRATKAARESITREMAIALLASAKRIENEAKTSIMSGNKSGRVYQRGAVSHTSSAPGEAPANDTGRLVNSISSYLVKANAEAVVTAGRGLVKYARMLEFGTSKMAARPFFFPAAEKSKAWIQDRLNKALRNGLIKASKK